MTGVRSYAMLGVVGFFTVTGWAAGGTPVDRAWATLNQALSEGQVHREEATAALGAIDPENERAVKLLEDALQDKESLVRKIAAEALGEMKARQAISFLKEALSDNGEVAFAAAKSLSDMGDPAGRDMFVAVIAGDRSDAPGMLTNAIRDAKKRLRHPEGLVLMGAENAGEFFIPPASYGIMAAQGAFKEKGSSSRAVAASYLEKDTDPYATTLLEWALTDNSHGVRIAAARALAKRGNTDSIPKLEALLDDDHVSVKTMAAAAIIHISDRQGGTK